MLSRSPIARPSVLIVGGGIGGLSLARALGCEAIGPVQGDEIAAAITSAMQWVRAGAACVVDLRVDY